MINKIYHKFVLPDKFNENLNLLKRHLFYQESGHILNIIYNTICCDMCLEETELQ